MLNPHPLFHPVNAPVKGLWTARSPFVMEDTGRYILIQNLRWFNGIFTVRDGIRQDADIPVASASHRGSAYGSVTGSSELWAVFDVGGATSRIYSTFPGTSIWFERTATTSEFGNSRMAASAVTDFFGYGFVTDPQNKLEFMIVGGNEENPRIYGAFEGADVMGIHKAVTPPSDAQQQKVVFTWAPYHVAGGAGTTPSAYTNSDADFALALNGAAPDCNIRLTRSAGAAAANSTAEAQWTATIDLSGCHTLNMVVESSWAQWLEWISKIEIRDSSGTYSSIWEGQNGELPIVRVPLDPTSKREVWSFSLDAIASTSRDVVDRIRFTLGTATAPSASQTLDIYAIGGGTAVPGASQYAYTYFSQYTRSESQRLFVGNMESVRLEDIGGRSLSTSAGGTVRIPIDYRLLYSATCYYQNTTDVEQSNGVDALRIYRKDLGDEEYFLAKTVTLSTNAGSGGAYAWSYASGSALTIESATDSTEPEDKDKAIRLPVFGHSPLPTAIKDAWWSNGRLWVIGSYDTGAVKKYELFASELDNPWRYRRFNLPNEQDERAPVYLPVMSEGPTRILSSTVSTLGTSQMFLVTDKSVWSTIGRDYYSIIGNFSKVAPHGSEAPRSVVEYRGKLFFFDTTDMQIRMLSNGGIDTPSRFRVDNKLNYRGVTPAAARYTVTCEVVDEVLYVGYSTNSATINDRCLGYSLLLDEWIFDDGAYPSGYNLAQFVRPQTSTERLLVLTYLGKLLEYEDYGRTQDGSTDISVALTWGYTMQMDYTEFSMRRFRVVADAQTSASLTGSRLHFPSGGTLPGTVSLNAASGSGWVMEVLTAPTGKARGWAIQPSLTGTLKGGKRILAVDIESDHRRESGAGSVP